MKKCLICCVGYCGDSLFASSVAKPLKDEQNFDQIDYLIGFPQTKPILEQNPNIDQVFVQYPYTPYVNKEFVTNCQEYDQIYTLPVNDLSELPTILYQKACGIKNISKSFPCQLPFEYYSSILPYGYQFGICATWKKYDDSLRDFLKLKQMFETKCDEHFGNKFEINFVIIGNGCSQYEGANDVEGYLQMGKTMMQCDAILGCEGGLLNLASSLGVDTICATDFTKALNERIYHVENVFDKLTPRAFFGDSKHYNISPEFDTDEQIVDEMFNIILKKYL